MITFPPRRMMSIVLLTLTGVSCSGVKNGSESQLEFETVSASTKEPMARVDGQPLYPEDLQEYAEIARQLRKQAGVPVEQTEEPGNSLDMALEFIVLGSAAEKVPPPDPVSFAETRKRLLARAFLKRLADMLERQPVGEVELKEAYQEEILDYLRTGNSEVYRPRRVDAAAIVIGYFPDLHAPLDDEKPVVERAEAMRLGREIHRRCAQLDKDLDAFLKLGRSFMKENPTVVIKEFWKVITRPELAAMEPFIHRAIVALEANGQIGEPVETPYGVFIFRRGVEYEGKGEDLEEVREVLARKVRDRRLEQKVKQRIKDLISEYRVQKWPGRIVDPGTQDTPGK